MLFNKPDTEEEGAPSKRLFFSCPFNAHFDKLCTNHRTFAFRSRQTHEKLQWFYENLMSNNFRKTAVLKKNINVKKKLGGVPVLKFPQRLALDFPYICL